MSGLFTPLNLFAAIATQSGDDQDLAPGVHIRLVPSAVLGLPLCPFGLWRADLVERELSLHWTDRRGNPAAGLDLDAAGGELHAFAKPQVGDPHARRLLAVRLLPDDAEDLQIAVMDRVASQSKSVPGSLAQGLVGGRVISARSRKWEGATNQGPLMAAAPMVEHFRVRGTGSFTVRGFSLDQDLAAGRLLEADCEEFLGLPIDGSRDWYAGADGKAQAKERVARGAPLRLGPPDQPDGPFDPVNADVELARVFASAEVAEMEKQLEELLQENDNGPFRRRLLAQTLAMPLRPAQRVLTTGAATLLLQALDPGLGRHLGLMTVREGMPQSLVYGWLAAGVFGLDASRLLPDGRKLIAMLGEPHPLEERLIQRFITFFPELAATVDRARAAGRLVRVLVTAAAAPLPPDRPGPAEIVAGAAQWLIGPQVPSTTFRQELCLTDLPLATLCAVARRRAGVWIPVHRQIATQLGQRRVPTLLGRNAHGDGIVSDANVAATETPVRYRIRLGDLFGRYGSATELDVHSPERPKPPRPAVQARLDLNSPAPESDAALRPGKLIVAVPTPRLEDLGAGAQPLVRLRVQLDNQTVEQAVGAGFTVAEFVLTPLARGDSLTVELRASFVDAAGTSSEVTTEIVKVTDTRPPKPPRTSPGIIWTSRPGPSEDVELRLTWPGRADHSYRLYIADAQGLLADDISGRSRAAIAEAVGALGAVSQRERFRLLTDPPIDGQAGTVQVHEILPRSLQTLQLVRVVPMSRGNVEADFASCGLVPVAVPSDSRPPPPRLEVTVDPVTGVATIIVDAPGLNRTLLRSAEPGLFNTPPADSARRPEYRLRRAITAAPDPIYARELSRGSLARAGEGEGETFQAEYRDGVNGGLVPFVRYTYWAEVRMPPERRLPRGAREAPLAGGITGAIPEQTADMPGLFSGLSAAADAMWTPPAELRIASQLVTAVLAPHPAEVGRFQIQLNASGLPTAHPRAIAPYRLRMWMRVGTGAIELMSEGLPTEQGTVHWASSALGASGVAPAAQIIVALIDPIGRIGPPLEIPTQAM